MWELKSVVIGAVCLVLSPTFSTPALAGPHNVRDYGSTGDGVTLETASIQAAIDACAAVGGGTVLFPSGKYLTGTIFLKDHVALHLETGAVMLGSTRLEDYPVTPCDYPSRSDAYTARALIWGENLRDVAITGLGTIDGQGGYFRDNKATPEDLAGIREIYEKQGRYVPNEVYFNRPYLIRLISCRDVTVEDVTLRSSAMWMQHYLHCEFVKIRGIKVFNHGCANNDMIDIDSCRNVIISDCFGDSDDDALTLKATGPDPTEKVTITNCVLASHCNAIKAGTESSGGFKDITISNCVIQRSSVEENGAGRPEGLAGIALEIVDGGTLERVAISNITVVGTSAPIFLRLGNRARAFRPGAPKPAVGVFRDVTIGNIVATGAYKTGCSISGIPGYPIENVSLNNIRITFAGGGTPEEAAAVAPEVETKYPESTMFGVLPAYGLFCRHVSGLTLRDIEFGLEATDARPALVVDDVQRLRLGDFRAAPAPEGAAQVVLRRTRDAMVTGCIGEGAAFLRVEEACEGLRVMNNDFSRTENAVGFTDSTAEAALSAEYNLTP